MAPEIQVQLNVLFPEMNAGAEFINELAKMHMLRKCHLRRRAIETRALALAANNLSNRVQCIGFMDSLQNMPRLFFGEVDSVDLSKAFKKPVNAAPEFFACRRP